MPFIFNGSTNIYILNEKIGNPNRYKLFLDNLDFPKEEKTITDCSEPIRVIGSCRSHPDVVAEVRKAIHKSKLIGVDILVVSFHKIYKGYKGHTAYRIFYTSGGSEFTANVHGLDEPCWSGMSLSDIFKHVAPMPRESINAIAELCDSGKLLPLISYKRADTFEKGYRGWRV